MTHRSLQIVKYHSDSARGSINMALDHRLNLGQIYSLVQYIATRMIEVTEFEGSQQKLDLFEQILMISSTDSINPSPDFFWFDHGSEKPCSIISADTPVEPGLTSFESPLKSGGCNCTRSKCLKNYCPCHRDGNKCNEICHCTECKNTPFIPKRLTYSMGTICHFSALPFTL